jgi:membrane protease YdiL (CAAX protease family)
MKKIGGRDFWHEPDSGRLYCWWRVLIFLGVALLTTYLFCMVLALPLLPPSLATKTTMPATVPVTVDRIMTVALIAGFWFAGAWAVRRFEQLPLATLGLSLRGPWLRILLASLLAGVAIPALLGGAMLLFGKAHFHHQAFGLFSWQQLGAATVLIMLVTVKEELILHGYLLQTLLRGIGLSAWLLLSLLFVLYMYLQDPTTPPMVLANVLVLVLLFGMVYLRTGTLWASIGISTGWSLGLLFLHPSPVEGLAGTVTPPIFLALSGPRWLSGGSAGPEGSMALSIILLIVLAAVTYARKGLALDSQWWDWRNLQLPTAHTSVWDFSIGTRHYQWKLLLRDTPK